MTIGLDVVSTPDVLSKLMNLSLNSYELLSDAAVSLLRDLESRPGTQDCSVNIMTDGRCEHPFFTHLPQLNTITNLEYSELGLILLLQIIVEGSAGLCSLQHQSVSVLLGLKPGFHCQQSVLKYCQL